MKPKLLVVAGTSASFGLSLTILPIRIAELRPDGRLHIVCNTGEKVETRIEMGGKQYDLTGCDLPEGKYIDVICDLTPVVLPLPAGQ